MTEHDETLEDAEVEAHGLKEVAATGLSAAALLAAGAGAASAATPQAHATGKAQAAARLDKKSNAAPTNKLQKKDATLKVKRASSRAVDPTWKKNSAE